jgi:hypothetical protein
MLLALVTHGHSYVNNVTGTRQASRPPAFCGGLLADSMGLGKTCSTIALIARDKEKREHTTAPYERLTYGVSESTMATLLVVPFSREWFLNSWPWPILILNSHGNLGRTVPEVSTAKRH